MLKPNEDRGAAIAVEDVGHFHCWSLSVETGGGMWCWLLLSSLLFLATTVSDGCGYVGIGPQVGQSDSAGLQEIDTWGLEALGRGFLFPQSETHNSVIYRGFSHGCVGHSPGAIDCIGVSWLTGVHWCASVANW